MIQAPERSEEMQRIARQGQRFVYRYLHTTAKAMYVRQAILEYNKLFKVKFIRHSMSQKSLALFSIFVFRGWTNLCVGCLFTPGHVCMDGKMCWEQWLI